MSSQLVKNRNVGTVREGLVPGLVQSNQLILIDGKSPIPSVTLPRLHPCDQPRSPLLPPTGRRAVRPPCCACEPVDSQTHPPALEIETTSSKSESTSPGNEFPMLC
ncbi:hypothetical protein JZ751_020293, partial [Albula glossodonta]